MAQFGEPVGIARGATKPILGMLGKELGLFADQPNLLDLDPSQWTPDMLDRMAEHLIRKARGNIPKMEVERIKAELEAGRDPGPTRETVEATFEPADDRRLAMLRRSSETRSRTTGVLSRRGPEV